MQIKNTNKNGYDIPVYVFKNVNNDKTYYRKEKKKKNMEGNYINGYMTAVFNKDVELDNKTKIILKNAILDFYIKEKNTIPFIRVFDFEIYNEDGQFVTLDEDEGLPF